MTNTFFKNILIIVNCLIIIALSFTSCTDKNGLDSALINTSDEFSIDLFQDLDAANDVLILQLSTFEIYDCNNYYIDYDITQADSEIKINLHQVRQPETCEGNPSVATCQIPINLETAPSNQLQIWFNDEIFDSGVLENSEDHIDLSFGTSYGIKSFISDLNKLPDDVIVGFFEFKNESQVNAINQLLSSLAEFTVPLILEDGYYGHFSVVDQQFIAKSNNDLKIGFQLDVVELDAKAKLELITWINNESNKLEPEISLQIFETVQ